MLFDCIIVNQDTDFYIEFEALENVENFVTNRSNFFRAKSVKLQEKQNLI